MLSLRSSLSTATNASRHFRLAPLISGRASLSTVTTPPTVETALPAEQAPEALTYVTDYLSSPTPPQNDEPPIGGQHPRRTTKPVHRGYPAASPSAAPRAEAAVYRIHCRATRNNTMVTVTEGGGRTVAWFSGGSLKFKGVNRSTYEAGYQCAKSAIETVKQLMKQKETIALELVFNGFGQGRDAMKTALLAAEGEPIRKLFSQVQDRTPIKIGGCRAPKARRL